MINYDHIISSFSSLTAMNSTFPDGRVTETKEPETGREPSGPDQSLPVSAAPRTQHTAHSSFAESSSFVRNIYRSLSISVIQYLLIS